MNKYEQIYQIGRGSFGVVYKCRMKQTGYFVALKIISMYGKTQSDLEYLYKEIQIQQAVRHPNIIRFYESFEEDNNIIIVSELAQTDLFEICQIAPLPIDQVYQIAYQITSVLETLHGLRIVHRDIKPQNVLVTSDGYCKLCDFGFARYMSLQTLNLYSLKGSPIYLAPEIAKNYSYDAKSDIWSLGIMLFELSTGKPPFVAKDFVYLISILQSDNLSPAYEKYSIFQENPYFKSFIEHCLRRNPERRYSASQLMSHAFLSNSSPNLLLIKNMSEVDQRRDWYRKVEFEPVVSNDEYTVENMNFYPQEFYAKVDYSVRWYEEIAELMVGLEQEFPLFGLFVGMMQNPAEIDGIFTAQPIADIAKYDYHKLIDYDYLRALKGPEYYRLKMDFVVFLLAQYKQFYFRLIVSFANYRNYQLNRYYLIFCIILARTICFLFGLYVQFEIPAFYGKDVRFPFDMCFAYECMQIPINQDEKIRFVGNIWLTNDLLNSLGKEKHIVDAFEIIVCFLSNNVAEGTDGNEEMRAYRTYFATLLFGAIYGMLNIGQLLYIQFIPYLRANNRVIDKSKDEQLCKSINYDVDLLEIQAMALPYVGKVKLPEFFKYYDNQESGLFHFQNLNFAEDKTEFLINVVVKLIFHFQDHAPRIASLMYEAFKKTYYLAGSSNVQGGADYIFNAFYEGCLNQLYNQDQALDDKGIQIIIDEVVKNVYIGLSASSAYDVNTKVLGFFFLKTMYSMVLDCQIMLPLLIVRKYPIPALLNQRRYFLTGDYQEFDFVADIDSLLGSYKKVFMLQGAISESSGCILLKNILQNYKVLLQIIFACLPFICLQYNAFSSKSDYNEEDIQVITSLHKLNQDYYGISVQLLAQIISPDVLTLLPHCCHLQRDKFPSFWYSEYTKKIAQEKQFVISEDNLQTGYLYELCHVLYSYDLPRRGHYLITHAPLITSLENLKNLNLPCSSQFVKNSINGSSAFKVVQSMLISYFSQQNSLQYILAQTMIGGLIYLDGSTYKAFLKFLTVSINMHSAVDMSATLSDFLYYGAPHQCIMPGKDEIDEQQYEDYYNNSEVRVKFLQLLIFLANKNPGLCYQIINVKFPSGNQEISYITLLAAQILWLTSSGREEECRINLLLAIFQNCPSFAFKTCEQDAEELRIAMENENIDDYVVIRHLLGRILVFIRAYTEHYLNSNEQFKFELNYNLQFIADLADGKVIQSADELFKYPYYQLSSGSRLVLPIVNEVVENDLQVDAILRCVQFINVLLEQYFDFGEKYSEIVGTLSMALEKIVECLIVEAPLFASETMEPYAYGYLDPIFNFLSLVAVTTPSYFALLNKALIIANLALENSVLASSYAAFSPPIHLKVKPGLNRQYQLICAQGSCPTCLYNINNAVFDKENRVAQLIYKLDNLYQNRNYSFLFFNWGFLYSPRSVQYLTKIVENLIQFYQQRQQRVEYHYSADLEQNLAISELIRLLVASTTKQYVAAYLCMPEDILGGAASVENMFMLVTRALFNIESIFADSMLLPLFLLEYGVPESLLHAIAYLKKPKSPYFAFALIFRFMYQNIPQIQRAFANQFAFSGALLSDYKNDLLAVENGAAKHLAIGEYLGIVGLVARSDAFYYNYLKAIFDASQLKRLFALPQLHVYLFALASALSKHSEDHQPNLRRAVEVAQDILSQPTADKLVLLQIFNFFHEAGKWPLLAPAIAKMLPGICKFANSTFDDLEIRYAAFLAMAALSRTQFAEVYKLQLGETIHELLKTVDRVRIMHFPLCHALIILKQSGALDDVLIDEIRRRFATYKGVPIVDALLE